MSLNFVSGVSATWLDRIVRDDDEFAQKLGYIVGNSWKSWPDIGDNLRVWPLGR